jgi:hypothetical protein
MAASRKILVPLTWAIFNRKLKPILHPIKRTRKTQREPQSRRWRRRVKILNLVPREGWIMLGSSLLVYNSYPSTSLGYSIRRP